MLRGGDLHSIRGGWDALHMMMMQVGQSDYASQRGMCLVDRTNEANPSTNPSIRKLNLLDQCKELLVFSIFYTQLSKHDSPPELVTIVCLHNLIVII